MSWNDGVERKKFERQWSKDEKAYREAGMTEEQILSIREMEEEQYRSDRRYHTHTQTLNPSDFGDGDDEEQEDKSALFNKFQDELTVTTEYHSSSRYGWIEEIEDINLARKLKELPNSDLALITMIAFDGLSQSEIAKKMACNQSVISRKMARIKNFLSSMS